MNKYLIDENMKQELEVLLADRPTMRMQLYTLDPVKPLTEDEALVLSTKRIVQDQRKEIQRLEAKVRVLKAGLAYYKQRAEMGEPTFTVAPPAPAAPAAVMPFSNAGMPG
jgi:hypothetical protein